MLQQLRLIALAICLPIGGCSELSFIDFEVFERRCRREAGLSVALPAPAGIVASDLPSLEDNLWLLTDTNAIAVEAFGRPLQYDDAVQWNWPTERALWRAEMVPRSDDACAPFDAWLARLETEERPMRTLPPRLRDPASYSDRCPQITFPSETERAWRLNLRRETASLGSEGLCHRAYGYRYALTDGDALIFVINGMSIRDACVIDGDFVPDAACGDPSLEDLFTGRQIFFDTSTEANRASYFRRAEDCEADGLCWEQRASMLKRPYWR